MRISEEFPSKYLKAADLQGREARVIMAHVEREKIGEDNKPVLYFKGKEKGVVLNKTNAGTISDAYGDDTEDWFDQELILFSVMVDFQGKVGPAIRVRVPTAKDRKKPDPISSGPQERSARNEYAEAHGKAQPQHDMGRHPMDEEIPF